MIFARHAAFYTYLSSCSDCSRCRWCTHLTNHGCSDYRKNPKTPNLSPMPGSKWCRFWYLPCISVAFLHWAAFWSNLSQTVYGNFDVEVSSGLFRLKLKIHRHGWSKISVFPFFVSLLFPDHIWTLVSKNITPLKCIILVITMCNLHCWIQISPVFQNVPWHMNIWPDLWVTSLLEWKGTWK